ncbi:SCO3374 family protein [Streptomyces sp. NPDC000070]|uniref:SCO3374 family protein n=1 Tax=Streptomyces sp. NPDC000070 TaxID=3154240 RepID=UPI003332BFCB
MSYPYGPEVHAERPPSLRYGRTTLRLPAPPARPRFATVCARNNTQRNPHVLPAVALGMFGAPGPIPLPRRPLDASCRVRRWYENELGWPTVPGAPLRLAVGVRYDVLDVPAEAGHAALRRLGPVSPVALLGDRMRLLVAPGSAEELPGLLEWLEWGTLPLDLTAIGAGGAMEAPWPPGVDTPVFHGADGSVSRERGGLPPCETAVPLIRETDGSVSRARGGLPTDGTGAFLFRETDGSMPHKRGGLPPCETDVPLIRETDGLMPRETGGSLPDGTGRPLPHEMTHASFFHETDRETGGSLPCEEGFTPPGPERGGLVPRQAFAPSNQQHRGTYGALSPEPGFSRGRPLPLGRFGSQGAAVWLRPPEPGCEVEASLPTLSALGGGGDAPDLVRLVNTVATQCHRVRLRHACAQPPALRAQGR